VDVDDGGISILAKVVAFFIIITFTFTFTFTFIFAFILFLGSF